jgi:hypothetical protein
MAITKAQLSAGLQAIRNQFNDQVDIDIEAARVAIADQEAQLISDFVVGRTTNVTITGTSATGGAVTGTGTGTIQ